MDTNYTYVFISPEIALLKKFKKHVLDRPEFTDWLYLLAIDEIHLVDEWGKQFQPLYSEIQKVKKQIPCHIPLLGILATLTKKAQSLVIQKIGFLPNFKLMQTLFDHPEIM